MRIGLVRRGYSATGGAEAFLKRFAAALVERGHECVLFASPEWPRAIWTHGEVCAVAGKSPRTFADTLAAMQPRRRCDFLFSLERISGCDCYRAGDGVHRAWLDRRAVYEPSWRVWFRGLNRKHREILELEKKLFAPDATRRVIANSKFVRDEIVRTFSYPAERIHVVYNGLPLEKFRADPVTRAEVRRELGIADDRFVALFAGGDWERKGLRFAIEGINGATKSKPLLLVAGRGSPRGLPRCDGVKFLGPVNGLERLLSAADMFVLPTIYDPFSNACLEALAAGLPVITTNANGFSEIIEPGVEGEVIAAPHDTGAIAAALEKWSDPARRAAIRPRLLALASKFDIATNVDATLRLFSSV